MKILPVRAELFHADRRTDMTNLIAAFRNLADAPEKKCTGWQQKSAKMLRLFCPRGGGYNTPNGTRSPHCWGL